MNKLSMADNWRKERAFRVGTMLARFGALLSIVCACLNLWLLEVYMAWGEIPLLLGALGSLVLTDPQHKKFCSWPLAIGYAAAIGSTLYITGEVFSPLTVSVVLIGVLVCFYGFLKTEKELATEFEAKYRELFETRASLLREEAANAAKSGFLANISHELRTPLGAIIGYVELLRDGIDENERREYLDIVQRNGSQLLRLVDDLLDLSKVEAGRLEIEDVEYSPSAIFEEVLDLFGLAADRKEIRLKVQFLSPIPKKVVGDPARFKQILVNLVSNAIKFTDSGAVTISTNFRKDESQDVARLSISVSDTGRGLTNLEKERLFQPFSQADASVSRKYGGTGLGLNLSRKLAKLLGGDLHLVHSELGVGSVFNLDLRVKCISDTTMVNEFGQTVCWPALASTGAIHNALRAAVNHPISIEFVYRLSDNSTTEVFGYGSGIGWCNCS